MEESTNQNKHNTNRVRLKSSDTNLNGESRIKLYILRLNFLHLKKDASKLIVSELEKRLKQTVMHKELGRQVSYQYLLRLECYKLIKHLIGEKEYEGFRIWW